MEVNELVQEGQAQGTETPNSNDSASNPEDAGKVNISMSGKSFAVDPDLAQAYTDLTNGINRRFDERSQELGSLRQFKSGVLEREQAAKPSVQEQTDYGTMMYENPNGFVDSIDQKIAEATEGLRAEYQQKETAKTDEKSFWEDMWSENVDLSKRKTQARDVIRMVGQKYSSLPNTKDSRDMIANEARTWIKNMVGGDIANSSDGFLEGGSNQSTQAKQKTEKHRRTGAQMLKDLQEKRRKAMETRQ